MTLLPYRRQVALTLLAALALFSGCSVKVAAPDPSSGQTSGSSSSAGQELSGSILIDGSSTVYPVTQAMAEEFGQKHPKVSVPVGSGGTGTGFKKLTQGEIDIAGASRPITPKETDDLKAKGIDALELQVAIDGLSVVVNKDNDWCQALTVKQLHELWKPDSSVKTWKDLDPAWPDSAIKLFGAGTNSGTFEYFTEVINGKKGASRSDYSQSEDDNQLVTGVAGDKFSLGYFGYSYFDQNRDRLKAVRIAPGDDPAAAVEPTKETIVSGRYTPLARPVFIYVAKKALARREVAAFLEFYVSEESQPLVAAAHCIGLNAEQLKEQQKRLKDALSAVTR
jgi:phosphate transport system substrate-binding protein